jgi:hypothetical protein
MKPLRKLCVTSVIAALCVSCASSPVVGYHGSTSSDSLVVTQEFQFTTGPSAVSHMQHTWWIPAGVYRAIGADNNGTYYAAPHRYIRLKARFATQTYGGLYRRGDRFFTYTKALTEMNVLFTGSKPYVWDELPPEFAKFVAKR